TPTPTATTTQPSNYLWPTAMDEPATSTNLVGSVGAPLVDSATNTVDGLLKSDGSILSLAGVTPPSTADTCPGTPANPACLTAQWKAAIEAAYYKPGKHDLSKLQALAEDPPYNNDFGGAKDFLMATQHPGGRTPAPANTNPLESVLQNPFTI